MTDRIRSLALLAAAALLILSAGAHALSGEVFLREALGAARPGGGATAVLSAGWQLGSVSLLAFGLVALSAGLTRWKGQPVASTPLWIMAAVLTGYGFMAGVLGDRTFFLVYFGYMVIGGLVALGAVPGPKVSPG